jgi:hypothetical protein
MIISTYASALAEDIHSEEDYMIDDPPTTTTTIYTLDFSVIGITIPSSPVLTPDPLDLPTYASLLVSLLITILECGSPHRPLTEEALLQSLVTPLTTIANTQGEIAEMSSHALALIMSRSAFEHSPPPTSAESSLLSLITSAKTDLQSDLPPLRARGVALVTKLVQQIITDHDVDQTKVAPKIVVLDDTTLPTPPPTASLSDQLIEIVLIALADDESYVYLAAVFAMVAITDANPTFGMRVMAEGVGLGVISSKHFVSLPTRIKLAEGLVHSVLRRESGMTETTMKHTIDLLMCALRSSPSATSKQQQQEHAAEIQLETTKYFSENKQFTAGGPLFEVEENEVCVASALNCLCEVAANLNVGMLERVLFKLVGVATQTFQQPEAASSRTARRGAGLLARALYERAVEDVNAEGVMGSALCVEFQKPAVGEDVLRAVLEREVQRGGSGDEAVRCRCEEALAARNECERLGVWQWARERGRVQDKEASGVVGAVNRMLLS